MMRILAGLSENEPTITWIRSKVSVPTGPYGIPLVEVVQYTSADGRFTITPVGGMIHKRSHGFRGQVSTRWSWRGFKLTDAAPVPAWVGPPRRVSTVSKAKQEAERRARTYPSAG